MTAFPSLIHLLKILFQFDRSVSDFRFFKFIYKEIELGKMTEKGIVIRYISNPLMKKMITNVNPKIIVMPSKINAHVVLAIFVPPHIICWHNYTLKLKNNYYMITHFVHLLHYVFSLCHFFNDK